MRGKPTHWLDGKAVQVVYVGGPHPYFWFGDSEQNFIASVDADKLAEWIHSLVEQEQKP